MLDHLTESPTARLPSGSPLDLLPARQRIVFLARAGRVPMNTLAELLGLSRKSVYEDLHAAWTTLKRVAPCQRCGVNLAAPGRLLCRDCRTAPGVKAQRSAPTTGGSG